MELHEKIAKAREVMTERGHCRMEFQNAQGQVCIRGAYALAMTGNAFGFDVLMDGTDVFLADFALANGYWKSEPGQEWSDSAAHVFFNNQEETTEADVLNFLHEAEIAAKELTK